MITIMMIIMMVIIMILIMIITTATLIMTKRDPHMKAAEELASQDVPSHAKTHRVI